MERSITDLSNALGILNNIFSIISFIFVVVASMLYFDLQSTAFVSTTSFLLAYSFAFGDSIQKLFESIIFLFVRHPFDTGIIEVISGDRIFIDGLTYIVTEMKLLTTAMKYQGKIIYMPNGKIILIY